MPARRRLTPCLVALLLLLACGAAATSAHASVAIGAQRVVIATPSGAQAIVTRAPFGLRLLDARGRVVLSEVARARRPMVIAPHSQLEFGTIGAPAPTLYAPMSFLVGAQRVTQTLAGQWEGTLQSVAESGVAYSAQAVLGVRRRGGGAVLTLSTNDPTHRRLTVTIAPAPVPDGLSVSVRPTPSAGVAAIADSFRSPSGEAFHGFGGRHNSLDQHGSEFYNWLQQENVTSGSTGGLAPTPNPATDRYMFPNGPQAAYYVQSSFVSSGGYGFLLARDELSHWRLDSDRAGAWQTEVTARGLDYVVIPSSPLRAVGELTRLTGRQPVPPNWALGSLLDRLVKFPSDPPAHYEQEMQSDLDNIDRHHLHLDGYRIEGWPELPRAVLQHYIAEFRRRGIHPLLYFRAFVGQDTTGTDDPRDFDLALARGYVATHADGSPYIFTSNFSKPGAVIDFTNPAAVRWWQGRIQAGLELGADGFMQDFGEQVLSDMHFHDGSTGAQMHNRLPVLYDRATKVVVDAYERQHPGRRIFYFTRAGYSGTPGNAAYEFANFPGDETTDWTRAAGLASQTTDMLNRAIGGAYGFSTDIGGYFDVGPYPPTTRELFLRWAEWAALSPIFRLHGSVLAGTHTPWSYDAETVGSYAALTRLHLRARPLIQRLWQEADRTGVPVTRPLWLAYPGDRRAARADQEWLLGPDVLVAPVVTEAATSRVVYFPRGCWQSPITGRRYRGGAAQLVAATLTELPYFFQCGTRPF
ncbi:MAG: TIM-barrel domain-containing protein [Solirubrobacteraceae bacterium]